MKKKSKWLLLSFLLLFYAGLYMATSKKEEPCQDDCQKFEQVDSLLRKNRPYVYGTYRCRPTLLCVYVNDSLQMNWDGLADTTCTYLQSVALDNSNVRIIGNFQRDTLVKKECP